MSRRFIKGFFDTGKKLTAGLLPNAAIIRQQHLYAPRTTTKPISSSNLSKQYYTQRNISTDKKGDIEVSYLRPENEDDYQIFKKIITNESIVFTSSWMDKGFGIKEIKDHCDTYNMIFHVIKKLGPQNAKSKVLISNSELEKYEKGESKTQIALDNFFSIKENDIKLRKIFSDLSQKIDSTGLGYYKFTDNEGRLLGGGALIPIDSDGSRIKKVDIGLHILHPLQGTGSRCLGMLLAKAFEEKGVDEVRGTSISSHPGTPTLCARFGMVIRNEPDEGMKYYYISKRMWEAYSSSLDGMNADISAAKLIFSKTNNSDNQR